MSGQIRTPHALVVIDDMIFSTKIQSTARAVGTDVLLVKPGLEVGKQLQMHHPAVVIVDLGSTGEAGLESVAAARCHAASPEILAYLPHVETDLARRASECGAHEVMPRSRFNHEMPKILAACASKQGARNGIPNDRPIASE